MTLRRAFMAAVVIALFAWPVAARQQRTNLDPEALFQKALYQEQVELKLEAAIAGYKEVAAAAGTTDRNLAAKALLHMAQCYERLGRPEANETYARIVGGFAPDNEAVTVARARLSALEQKGRGLVLEHVSERSGRFVTPDGRFVTLTDWNTNNIAIHEFETGKDRLLTTDGHLRGGGYGQWPMPSPDGRLIAYQWWNPDTDNTEIRVVSKDGGSPRVIYKNDEQSTHTNIPGTPAGWTPDAKSILTFLRTTEGDVHRELVLLPLDGGAKKVIKRYPLNGRLQTDTARLSPDGRSIAYTLGEQPGQPEIYCVSVATGAETKVVPGSVNDFFLAWFPDSQRILFLSDRTGATGMWSRTVKDCQPVGEPVLVLANSGSVWAQGFSRSGDFYFTRYDNTRAGDDVYVANLDPATGRLTGKLEPLTSRLIGNKTSATWSMDGNRIAFLPSDGRSVVVRDVGTGADRTFALPLNGLHNPVFLPDGNIVVQGSNTPGVDGSALHLLNTTTGSVTPMNIPVGRRPAVSRDGRLFAITSSNILSRELATNRDQNVGGVASTLALSPDGNWLAVLREPETEARLTIVPSTGGPARSLDAVKDWVMWWSVLAWTADGRHVLVARRMPENNKRIGREAPIEIWQVPVDGSSPRATGIEWDGGIDKVSVHPDGRLLISAGRGGGSATWVLRNLPAVK